MDRTIAIGTLIHGTLRDQDLLPAFADELERVSIDSGSEAAEYRGVADIIRTARQVIKYMAAHDWDFESLPDDAYSEYIKCAAASLINEELIDALQDYAPVHMYFGAIEGDGSDFGWWPSLDFDGCDTRSVPMNDGNDSIDVTCGIYISTNDHGNVTVSELRGEVIWAAV